MIQRSENPNHPQHATNYKNIYVHPAWRKSFAQFVLDKGKRPPGKTIDRWPDRNGSYTPANTRWAYPEQQAQNRNKPKPRKKNVQ
jgi:hypothetical protein